jgi:hypothetical protein
VIGIKKKPDTRHVRKKPIVYYATDIFFGFGFFEKPHITLKKASIPLKMYFKSFAHLENPSYELKKASISLKMSSNSLVIFIKATYFL